MLVLSVITSLNPHVCLGCFRCPCPRGGRRRLMLVSARILGGLEFGYDHDRALGVDCVVLAFDTVYFLRKFLHFSRALSSCSPAIISGNMAGLSFPNVSYGHCRVPSSRSHSSRNLSTNSLSVGRWPICARVLLATTGKTSENGMMLGLSWVRFSQARLVFLFGLLFDTVVDKGVLQAQLDGDYVF